MKPTLFNGRLHKCCAYCRHHRCGMTVKQMRSKECLRKQCWHLIKNEAHPYWQQREVTKQKREDRKKRIDAYVESIYA